MKNEVAVVNFGNLDIDTLNSRNSQGKCALCGKVLKGSGVKIYTDMESISLSEKPYVDEYGDSIQGHADVIIGTGCAKKHGLI